MMRGGGVPASGSPGTGSLVSWWKLDEASGTRSDSHGTNHLTANNSPLSATGKVSNAAQFVAASSQYLTIANNASLQTGDISFSFLFWYKPSTVGRQLLLGKSTTAAGNTEYYFELKASSIMRFGIAQNVTPYVIDADAHGVLSIDTWYFIAGWHDSAGDTVNIQINNGAINTLAHTLGVTIFGNNVSIGRLGEYNSLYANGLIDEVAFYKKALTASERTWLYNAGAGRTYGDL